MYRNYIKPRAQTHYSYPLCLVFFVGCYSAISVCMLAYVLALFPCILFSSTHGAPLFSINVICFTRVRTLSYHKCYFVFYNFTWITNETTYERIANWMGGWKIYTHTCYDDVVRVESAWVCLATIAINGYYAACYWPGGGVLLLLLLPLLLFVLLLRAHT